MQVIRAAMGNATRLLAVWALAGLLTLAGGASASARIASAVPLTELPPAPTGVVAEGGDQSALVSWVAPPSTGGEPVTGYLITASPGGATVLTDPVTSYEVGGLTNGTKYKFTVRAVTAAGTGPASKASKPTRASLPAPPTLPKKSVTATAANESAVVHWQTALAPAEAPVSGYLVTANPGGISTEAPPSASDTTLGGLANGTKYTITVSAVSAAGPSKAVKAKPVTPKPTVPAAPGTVSAAPEGSGQVTASWQAPESDGGSPITGYRVTAQPGNVSVSAPPGASSATVTGLNAAESYTVTVSASNTLGAGPSAEVTGVPAAAATQTGALALSQETLAALSSVSATGKLLFTGEPTQLAGVAAGDVLVAGISDATPQGLLVRVVSIVRSGGETSVATTPASLDETLETGGLAAASEPAEAQVAAFHAARSGVRLLRGEARHGLSLGINTDLYRDSSGQKITVSGSVSFTPTVTFSAGVHCCLIHTYSHFEGTLRTSSALQLSAQVAHGFKTGYPLGTVTFAPIPVDVAGVPFVLVPSLEVKLVASGSATVGLTTAVSASTTLGARLDTNDGSVSAKPVHRVSTGFTPPALNGSVSLKAGVQGTLKVAVDGVIGPYVRDTLYALELNVDPFANPWWTLKLENELGAGIDISLLHHTFANWSTGSLFDEVVPIAQAHGPFEQLIVTPSRPHVAAGGSVQLSAAAGGAPTGQVNWSVPAGQGTVSATGLYTAPNKPGNYRVNASSPGAGLQLPGFGSADIEVGAQPSDVPGEVIATATGPTSARVSWQPPQSGGPASGYTVTATPGGQQTTSATTSASVAGLEAGHTYTFAVVAQHEGQSSLPSAPSNAITTPEEGESPDNGVWGWGANASCELGKKTAGGALTPVHYLGLSQAVAVIAGATEFPSSNEVAGYALRSDGTVASWGYNFFGELGDGERNEEGVCTPKTVVGLADVMQIASFEGYGLALKADGTVWAWGLNWGGILGDHEKAPWSTTPVQLPGLSDVVAIAGGEKTGYALRSDGTVWAWGYGGNGRLGDGELHEEPVAPQPIPALSGVVAIGAGADFGLAVLADGSVMAWGGNIHGTLGNGSSAEKSLVPVHVTGLTNVTAVTGGAADAYALRSDGSVWAWGNNEGHELGNGGTTSSNVPVQVPGLGGILQVEAGYRTPVALRSDGTAWSWGGAGGGTIGNGSNFGSPTPVEVSGLTGATTIGGTRGDAFAIVHR